MIMSASAGRSGVVRWPRRKVEGSLCQNEAVESGVGRLAMFQGYNYYMNSYQRLTL